jgi:hypothetical protein
MGKSPAFPSKLNGRLEVTEVNTARMELRKDATPSKTPGMFWKARFSAESPKEARD